MKPRIKRDVIAGPHPDDPSRWLVFCSETGDHFEFPVYGWRIAEAFDGTRTVEEVAAIASQVAGTEVADDAVPSFVKKLEELGLLEREERPRIRPPPKDGGPQWVVQTAPLPAPEIWVHEEAGYTCACAGTCCESGYVVSLDADEVVRVRSAGLKLIGTEDPVCLLPRTPGVPWTWALSNDPRCPFLDGDHRCRLHDTSALPSTCAVYPMAFVRFQDRVHASVTHRCVCGALDRGAKLTDQLGLLTQKLRAVKHLPMLPARTRLDAYLQVDTAEAVEVLVGATDGARDPWSLLLEAIEGLQALVVEVDVGGEVARPAAIFARLSKYLDEASELTLAAALRRDRHPNRALIEESLRRSGLWAPHEDPEREALRFLRDYLSGLRIYRFTTLADGLFAASLALYAILDGAPSHPLARERIMLWEDALLSPVLRALLGGEGPLAQVTASIGNVARQVEAIDPRRSR